MVVKVGHTGWREGAIVGGGLEGGEYHVRELYFEVRAWRWLVVSH